MIVDLGGVTYIDSQAFGSLLEARMSYWTTLPAATSRLPVAAPVTRIIRTFGADNLLGVFDDVDSAASYLQPLIPHEQ